MEKNSVKKKREEIIFDSIDLALEGCFQEDRPTKRYKRVRYFLSSFRVIGCSSRALEKKKRNGCISSRRSIPFLNNFIFYSVIFTE